METKRCRNPNPTPRRAAGKILLTGDANTNKSKPYLFYWKFQTVIYSNSTNSTLGMNNHAGIYKPRYLAPERRTFLPIKGGAGATASLVPMTREITAGNKGKRRRKNENFSSRADMYSLGGKHMMA